MTPMRRPAMLKKITRAAPTAAGCWNRAILRWRSPSSRRAYRPSFASMPITAASRWPLTGLTCRSRSQGWAGIRIISASRPRAITCAARAWSPSRIRLMWASRPVTGVKPIAGLMPATKAAPASRPRWPGSAGSAPAWPAPARSGLICPSTAGCGSIRTGNRACARPIRASCGPASSNSASASNRASGC